MVPQVPSHRQGGHATATPVSLGEETCRRPFLFQDKDKVSLTKTPKLDRSDGGKEVRERTTKRKLPFTVGANGEQKDSDTGTHIATPREATPRGLAWDHHLRGMTLQHCLQAPAVGGYPEERHQNRICSAGGRRWLSCCSSVPLALSPACELRVRLMG